MAEVVNYLHNELHIMHGDLSVDWWLVDAED
jgi:hypothetical protein